MASEVSFTITAKDKASKTVDDLIKKTEKLEKEPAQLLLTSNAKDISKLIKDLTKQIDKLDANDPEIDVKADELNFVNGQLDKINAKIKEIGGTPVTVNTTRLRATLDDVGRSANSSKSALANMVGNTTQDLGALTGVAGSAGVAIGQMAEYMADARLEGERFSSVIGNFAKVGAPIALAGLGMQVISTALNEARQRAEESRQRVRDLAEAFRDAGENVSTLTENLKEQVAAMKGFEDFAATVDALGVSVADVAQATELTDAEFARFQARLEALGKETDTDWRLMAQLAHFIERARKEAEAASKLNELFRLEGAEDFINLIDAIDTADKPLEQFQRRWGQVFKALATGSAEDAEKAATAINVLTEKLGLSPEEVVKVARKTMEDWGEAIAQGVEDAIDATEELRDKWAAQIREAVNEAKAARDEDVRATDEWIRAQYDAAAALADVQRQINNLADPLTATARATRSISEALDISDNAIQSVEAVHDLYDELRNIRNFLAKDLKGVVPDVLDPNDIKAGPFLDKIRALRGPFDRRFSELFATQGPKAAKEWATGFVAQAVSTLGGALTADQVEQLLGIPELEATVKLAIDKDEMAQALEMLELLKSLSTGSKDKAWLAQLQLDLSAGLITPEAAQKVIAQALGDKGLQVPAELVPNTADAINAANTFIERNGPLEIPAQIVVDKVILKAGGAAAALADLFHDAGGIVGRGGGIVGERRPEIVNNKYLITSPTVVPAGTRVTGGARTSRILRTRGLRGFKAYDAGGVVAAGPQNVNISVNAAVVGNRYDVTRTVRRAIRDSTRLYGTRP